MKVLRRIALGLAAVIVLMIAALVFRLWRSIPPLEGRETVAGLGAPVDVAWDSAGIPHISAASDADAFRALGYLHARERLWQMETLRRAAEGRLSEVLGRAALSSDRYLRTLDIPRAAAASLALLPAESRTLLDAYVDGINAWIRHPSRPLPPEFLVLRFRPEPWTAENTFEVARIMAWDLVNAGFELNLARAAAQSGTDRLVDLLPWYPDGGAVIVAPGVGTWRQAATDRRTDGRTDRLPSGNLAAHEIPEVPELARAFLAGSTISRASNSWVIGPARTISGKPLLANDPHLDLRMPSIWYLATLASPSFQVSGVTLAGVPSVVIGHNRRIAWGLTNMEADDADYVIERLSADSSRVLTPSGWAPVEVVRESIRVKGQPAVPYALRRTPNGPLTGTAPGAAADSGGTIRMLALRWNGHTPSDELTAMLRVNRAGSWDEFLTGVRGFKAPEQNWIYADVDGNIGYTASGNIPVRRSGRGMLPTPGWTGEGAWVRYLAFEELPRVFNPPEGFIVTANNRIIGAEYPHHLAGNPALPYRAERIRELILAAARHDAAAVQRMQLDTLDVFARGAREMAAQAAAAVGRQDLATLLRAWDGTMGTDRREPVVFWLWYRALQRLTFDGESDYRPNGPFQRMLAAGASPWFDDPRTPEVEDLALLSRRAMAEAAPRADSLRWGDAHRTVAEHALGSVAVLDRLLRLNVGPRPRAGSLYTVNVADFGMGLPFVNQHAASWRQVVDLADVESARMVITSGQSGNPLSRRYRDHAQAWWRGELFVVPLSRGRVREVGVLRLEGR